jgi:hypothetical protein
MTSPAAGNGRFFEDFTVGDVYQHPLGRFAGDTRYGESMVLKVRESQSRPRADIITVHSRALNQEGVECLSWRRTVMLLKRVAGGAANSFPRAVTRIDAPAG